MTRKSRRVLGPDYLMVGGIPQKLIFQRSAGEELVQDQARGEVVIRAADSRMIRELVRRWFLKESSAYAVRKVSELAPLLGVRPSQVDTREVKSWGYCTRRGRLSFSWQLIALPERLREYVVLHELTHLLEFNHSPAFRQRLGAVCPDFSERDKELNLFVPYDGPGLIA
jgi:predicted metal-dependent hydrolase